MPTVQVIALIAQYGPSVVGLLQQCTAWIESGKTEVTAADLEVLVKLANKTSTDYLIAAGIKIVDGKVVAL